MILTKNGMVEESALRHRHDVIDNAHEHIEIDEYCLVDCPGECHKTGVADSGSHFCNLHVKRGGSVKIKEGLEIDIFQGKF